MQVDTDDLVSISEASNRLSKIVTEAAEGRDRVLVKNNVAVAAIVGVKRLDALQELERDMRDFVLAQSRMLTDKRDHLGWDELLDRLGITEDDLDAED